MKSVFALLERLPLSNKLVLGFAVLLGLILVLGVQSLRTQERLKRDMQQLYQKDLVGAAHLQEARAIATSGAGAAACRRHQMRGKPCQCPESIA